VSVCPPDHAHGSTHTCYGSHRCRCDDCRAGLTPRRKSRTRRIAYGEYSAGTVPIGPVREHLQTLVDAGWTESRIAVTAGVGGQTVWRIRSASREQRTVRVRVAEAILAVTPDIAPPKPTLLVPGHHLYRRVEALAALGWSARAVGEHSGITHDILVIRHPRVLAATVDRLRPTYDALSMTHPAPTTWHERQAVSSCINRARRRGWAPPLAWDDIDNDPAPATPDRDTDAIDDIAIALAVDGVEVSLTPAERRVAVEILHGRRCSDSLIAETLHVDPRTVLRIRDELHLPGIPLNDSVHLTAA
jgi:hypothetical protein